VLLAAHECRRLPGWQGRRGGLTLRGAAAAADLPGGQAAGADARRLSSEGEELYPEDGVLVRPYDEDPNRWLVFLHVIGIGYMLLGLNTVCDIYFTGALEEMVTEWQIKPDVAGATFMAAGGSAPEFFTALIGTTIAMSDVGSSTIVGSAVFNVLFVIGLCGFVAKEAIELTWWPLFRDCTYYIFGLIILALVVKDREIAVWEGCILFAAYIVYCTIMYFNPSLEARANSIGSAKVVPDVEVNNVDTTPVEGIGAKSDDDVKRKSKDSEDDSEAQTSSTRASPDPDAAVTAAKKVADDGTSAGATAGADDGTKAAGNGEEDEDDDDDDGDLMEMPEGGFALVQWCLSLPIYVPLYYLTPQPTSENWTFPIPKFLFCFVISLLWIASFAFLLVWWVEILGEVIGVPDIIMGFTILAAGTSIPDAVSSMAVARNGEGDMAVSSSIGSNIFDILVGLPVPWIIKTGIIEGDGYKVQVKSPYLVFYVLLLLVMVFASILSIHLNKWKLDKTLGVAMVVLYCVFLTIAIVVEYAELEFLEI